MGHPGSKSAWRAGAAAMVAAACASAGPATAEPQAALSLRMSDRLSVAAAAVTAPAATTPRASSPRDAVPPVAEAGLPGLTPRDYRIGPEDLLEVQVFGVDDLTRTVRVNSRGFVSLPLIGAVEVGGLTAQQAERSIVARLGEKYLQDPQVSLFIKEYTSQRVTVEGAVNKPGVYPLRGSTTLLQTLAVAGGQAQLSDMAEVMLFRANAAGEREALVYDVDRIRSGEAPDPSVVNDDLIVVKRSRARTILKDSVLRDVIDTLNPFRWTP